MRILLIFSLWLILSGCDRKYDEPLEFGAFIEVNHMADKRFDWEGGSTYIRYEAFCNKTTSECFYAKGKNNGPRWTRDLSHGASISGQKQYVAVRSNHRDKKSFTGEELSIFDFKTGVEIPCEGCRVKDRPMFSINELIQFFFEGEELILGSEKLEGGSTHFLFRKVIVGSKSYRIEDLTSFSEQNAINVYAIGVNEFGDLEATKCKETCWLWTKNLRTGEEKEYPSNCEGGFSLEWKNGVPIMHC